MRNGGTKKHCSRDAIGILTNRYGAGKTKSAPIVEVRGACLLNGFWVSRQLDEAPTRCPGFGHDCCVDAVNYGTDPKPETGLPYPPGYRILHFDAELARHAY
jgi:hypothetical protein